MYSEEPSLPYTVVDLRDQTSQFTEAGRPGRREGSGLEMWGASGRASCSDRAGLSAWTVNQALWALEVW